MYKYSNAFPSGLYIDEYGRWIKVEDFERIIKIKNDALQFAIDELLASGLWFDHPVIIRLGNALNTKD